MFLVEAPKPRCVNSASSAPLWLAIIVLTLE